MGLLNVGLICLVIGGEGVYNFCLFIVLIGELLLWFDFLCLFNEEKLLCLLFFIGGGIGKFVVFEKLGIGGVFLLIVNDVWEEVVFYILVFWIDGLFVMEKMDFVWLFVLLFRFVCDLEGLLCCLNL